jgi:hypothetical protein
MAFSYFFSKKASPIELGQRDEALIEGKQSGSYVQNTTDRSNLPYQQELKISAHRTHTLDDVVITAEKLREINSVFPDESHINYIDVLINNKSDTNLEIESFCFGKHCYITPKKNEFILKSEDYLVNRAAVIKPKEPQTLTIVFDQQTSVLENSMRAKIRSDPWLTPEIFKSHCIFKCTEKNKKFIKKLSPDYDITNFNNDWICVPLFKELSYDQTVFSQFANDVRLGNMKSNLNPLKTNDDSEYYATTKDSYQNNLKELEEIHAYQNQEIQLKFGTRSETPIMNIEMVFTIKYSNPKPMMRRPIQKIKNIEKDEEMVEEENLFLELDVMQPTKNNRVKIINYYTIMSNSAYHIEFTNRAKELNLGLVLHDIESLLADDKDFDSEKFHELTEECNLSVVGKNVLKQIFSILHKSVTPENCAAELKKYMKKMDNNDYELSYLPDNKNCYKDLMFFVKCLLSFILTTQPDIIDRLNNMGDDDDPVMYMAKIFEQDIGLKNKLTLFMGDKIKKSKPKKKNSQALKNPPSNTDDNTKKDNNTKKIVNNNSG